ncbi:hypothetical protein ABW07_18430, partial [Pluralibacter gergoviae]|uniref:hypothetical protein n=1 Tax=Pluralibacter gergoviae TaxID=61647 RepID=UPI00065117ED
CEFMDGVESLAKQHKKIRNPCEITDFCTITGSFNRSLTDRHYASGGGFCFSAFVKCRHKKAGAVAPADSKMV